MKRTLIIAVGFFLFVIGLTSIILQMVGMHFQFLRFLTALPPAITMLTYVLSMLVGLIMVYLQVTDWKRRV